MWNYSKNKADPKIYSREIILMCGLQIAELELGKLWLRDLKQHKGMNMHHGQRGRHQISKSRGEEKFKSEKYSRL